MLSSQRLNDKKDINKLTTPPSSLCYLDMRCRIKYNDLKNSEFKEASQNIMSQFNKLKDKRKKAEAKLIKANNKMKEFALKYGIENYYK